MSYGPSIPSVDTRMISATFTAAALVMNVLAMPVGQWRSRFACLVKVMLTAQNNTFGEFYCLPLG